jgi:hypothetical protein
MRENKKICYYKDWGGWIESLHDHHHHATHRQQLANKGRYQGSSDLSLILFCLFILYDITHATMKSMKSPLTTLYNPEKNEEVVMLST